MELHNSLETAVAQAVELYCTINTIYPHVIYIYCIYFICSVFILISSFVFKIYWTLTVARSFCLSLEVESQRSETTTLNSVNFIPLTLSLTITIFYLNIRSIFNLFAKSQKIFEWKKMNRNVIILNKMINVLEHLIRIMNERDSKQTWITVQNR